MDAKLLCEAEISSSYTGLVWCRVCHNALFNAGVFTSVFRSPNGFQHFGGVTYVTIFKALIMVEEAGSELSLATAMMHSDSLIAHKCLHTNKYKPKIFLSAVF